MGTASTDDSGKRVFNRPLLWHPCPVPIVGSKGHMEGKDWTWLLFELPPPSLAQASVRES